MAVNKESFARWQSIAIDQFSYVAALILTFSSAAIGFSLSLVKDVTYHPNCWAKMAMLGAIGAFIASLAIGLFCAYNRLLDFRESRAIARDREDWAQSGVSGEEIDRKLELRRVKVQKIGAATWKLLGWQMTTFFIGVLSLSLCFAISYHSILL